MLCLLVRNLCLYEQTPQGPFQIFGSCRAGGRAAYRFRRSAQQTNGSAQNVKVLGPQVVLEIRGPFPVLCQDEMVFTLRVPVETAGEAPTCFPGRAHPGQKGLVQFFALCGAGLHFQSDQEHSGSFSRGR